MLISLLFIFCFTAAISFVGSLQAGLVNVSVVRTALIHNRQEALWLAAGGSVPEMVYAWLALTAGNLLLIYPQAMGWAERFTGFLFLGMGIWQIYRPPHKILPGKSTARRAFWQGLGLGLANPQLFVFWLGVFVYLNTLILLNTQWRLAAFVVGTAAGAFTLLGGLAYLTHRFREKIWQWASTEKIQKLTGWLFIGLGIWKIWQLWG